VKRKDFPALVSRARSAVHDYLAAALAEAGVEGLAPSHGDILAALFREGELGMGELASAIRRKKNTVTVLVAKLEAQGYIERVSDPADARRSLVSLTRKGDSLREPFARISASMLARSLAGIGDADLEAARRCLERMIENLQE
jgi:MarR family transcriptional regulator, organic hydroperoxide resistance regulator